MDNEMIERMAKAIFKKRYEAKGTYQDLEWENYQGKEWYLEDARQAAKAMREPTENMAEAGADVGPDRSPKEYWDAMIKAIVE